MNHSVQEYIKRLSTERLKAFLEKYIAQELTEDFSYIIPYIRSELYQREQKGESPH